MANRIRLDVFIFLLVYCLGFDHLHADSKRLAICCIFRDEAKYLPEWIEFHEAQGVEHFFLYNNLSTDNYLNILQPWVISGMVETIEWPFECKNVDDWIPIQIAAYMDGIERAKDYQWCAFLDADEFLFSLDFRPLPEVLKDYKNFPAVVVNWVMYGTSQVKKIPDNHRITDYLVFRSVLDYPGNTHIKTIACPRLVKGCVNPHFFYYKWNLLACDENLIPHNSGCYNPVSVYKLRINHYWSRDRDFFYNVKLKRRNKWYQNNSNDIRSEMEMNVEYDPILYRFGSSDPSS